MASAELLSLSSSLSLPGALHAHLLMFSQLHQNKDEQLRETMAPGNLIKPQRQPDQQPSWKWLLSTELSPALLPTAPKVLICIPEKFHGNSTANRDAEAEGSDAVWRCLGSENLGQYSIFVPSCHCIPPRKFWASWEAPSPPFCKIFSLYRCPGLKKCIFHILCRI